MDTSISQTDLEHAGVDLRSPFRHPGEAEIHPAPEPRIPLGANVSPPRRNIVSRTPAPATKPADGTRGIGNALSDAPEAAAAPNIPLVPRPARRSRRAALYAGAALTCLLIPTGTGLWAFRDQIAKQYPQLGLQNLHLPVSLASLTGSSATTSTVAGEVGMESASIPTLRAAETRQAEAASARAKAQAQATPVTPSAAFLAAPPSPATQPSTTATAERPPATSDSLNDFASLHATPGTPALVASEVGVAPLPAAAAITHQPVAPAIPAAPVEPGVASASPTPAQPAASTPTPAPVPSEASASAIPAVLAVVTPTSTPAAAPVAAPQHGTATLAQPATSALPATPVSSATPAAPVAQITPVAPVVQPGPSAVAPAPAVATATAAAAAAAPADPVATAVVLQAAPMTPPQQVRVIGMINDLGAQLRDTRIQVAELKATVTQLSHQIETSTTDFENRLGLAEATTVLAASARAGNPAAAETPPSGSTTGAGTGAAPVRLASGRMAAPTIPVPPAPAPDRRTVKDYIVKGASPGLAVLSALNPTTGSPAVIEVTVGDQVPGLGRIKSISQRGTSWVVQTEGGAIQQ